MEYAAIKHIHLTAIVISLVLFIYRFYGAVQDVPRIRQAKWLKFTPHIVDTILLVSAIALAVKLGVSPGENSWLLAKIIALVLYIVMGSFAIKRGKTRQAKLISGIIAILIFAYIISVAITKNALGFIG